MNQEVSIDIMVPSCSCCSAKLEQDLAAASGISKAAVRFVVPIKAQLRYDPTVTKVSELVGALKERGYVVSVERFEFRLPLRPALLPAVWKEKVKGLSGKVEGIVSASIDFVSSRIVVDYLPSLISPKEIRGEALHWCVPTSDSKKKEVSKDETVGIHGGGSEPERFRRDNLYAVHPLGSGISRSGDDADMGSAAPGL